MPCELFHKAVKTLEDNIHRYDIGFWTVYHLLPTKLKMVASSYYQRLHIVQMEAMYQSDGKTNFQKIQRQMAALLLETDYTAP